jgi:hypothetical protein
MSQSVRFQNNSRWFWIISFAANCYISIALTGLGGLLISSFTSIRPNISILILVQIAVLCLLSLKLLKEYNNKNYLEISDRNGIVLKTNTEILQYSWEEIRRIEVRNTIRHNYIQLVLEKELGTFLNKPIHQRVIIPTDIANHWTINNIARSIVDYKTTYTIHPDIKLPDSIQEKIIQNFVVNTVIIFSVLYCVFCIIYFLIFFR